jgi:hypothetical protein
VINCARALLARRHQGSVVGEGLELALRVPDPAEVEDQPAGAEHEQQQHDREGQDAALRISAQAVDQRPQAGL